ncbi:hypothetical protein Btru_053639 [Bulinus truncatus]|nr:hypothetical protein Btru_053639 [Bulinus truncatus]
MNHRRRNHGTNLPVSHFVMSVQHRKHNDCGIVNFKARCGNESQTESLQGQYQWEAILTLGSHLRQSCLSLLFILSRRSPTTSGEISPQNSKHFKPQLVNLTLPLVTIY